MAEFNFTKNIDRSRIGRRYDLWFYIKNTENLFCGSNGRLQGSKLFGKLLDWLKKELM